MADLWGLSVDETRHRLDIQRRAGELRLKTKELLEDDYAGVWLDDESGELRVGLAASANQSAITNLVAQTFRREEWQFERVQATRSALESASSAIVAELRERGPVARVAIDDVNNRVVISLGSEASSADRTWAHGIRAKFTKGQTVPARASFPQLEHEQTRLTGIERDVSVDVEVRQTDSPALASGLSACSTGIRSCDAPIRGGSRIRSSTPWGSGFCSAGYAARWNNEPYLVTAGHCMYENPYDWQAIWKTNGRYYQLGSRHSWSWGIYGNPYSYVTSSAIGRDIGLIRMDTSLGGWGYDQNLIPLSRIVMWGWPSGGWDNWLINGQQIPGSGDFGCRSGATTDYTCGRVQYQSNTYPMTAYRPDGGYMITWVENSFNVPTACASGGDSGGPFINGDIVLGILSAGSPGNNCNTLYQHSFDVLYNFGVIPYIY